MNKVKPNIFQLVIAPGDILADVDGIARIFAEWIIHHRCGINKLGELENQFVHNDQHQEKE